MKKPRKSKRKIRPKIQPTNPRKPWGLRVLVVAILVALAVLLASYAKAADNYGPTTFTATADTFAPLWGSNREVATLQLTGITGTAGIQLEGTVDGSTWVAIMMTRPNTTSMSLTATANGLYQANIGGFRNVRVKAHYLTSGVARVLLAVGNGVANFFGTQATTPVP